MGLSSASYEDLQWRLGHLRRFFGSTSIDDITVIDVDSYRIVKIQEGTLKASSINKTLTTLAAILEMAVEYELIKRNPAVGRRRRLATTSPRRSWLDRAEHIRALLDAAQELSHKPRVGVGQHRALLATFVFAGLRLGEARALRWDDIDLVAGTLHVREAKTDAGVRTVNLLPVFRNELRAYKATVDNATNGLLFATRNGRPLGASNIRERILTPAAQRASTMLEIRRRPPLPAHLTPHSLRRTFASLLFALGECYSRSASPRHTS